MVNKIKNAAVGVFALSLVTEMIVPISAATFVQCNSYVNIRSQPYAQAPIVGYIENDGILQILEEDQFGWIKIKSGDVVGWMAKQYTFQGDLLLKGTTIARVVGDDTISVKECPDLGAIAIAFLHKGDQVVCLQSNNKWTKILLQDGVQGFVNSNLIEIDTFYKTAQPVTADPEPIYSVVYQKQIEEAVQAYISSYVSQEYDPPEENINYNYYSPEEYNYTPQQEEEYNYSSSEEYYNYEDYNYEQNQYLRNVSYEQEEENFIPQQQEQEEQIDISQEYDDITIPTVNTSNSDIIEYGSQFIGNPYVYGGNSLTSGIDCSHFVWQVLTNTGHYDGDYEVSDGWAYLGTGVSSLDDAVAGDVIVYPGHVALYDGQGGLLQARGSAYGITSGRNADYNDILAIRHFD